MLGRAVIAAAGAALLSGAAVAQTPPGEEPRTKVVAKSPVETGKPAAAEPDPLTPPEVAGPPPAAPGAPTAVTAPPTPSPAVTDPVLDDIRRQLGSVRAREAGADAADRAALVAFYGADDARVLWTDADGFNARARLVLDEIRKADDWGLKASAFALPTLPPGAPGADARAKAEIQLGLTVLRYARHARGGRIDPQSVSKLNDRKPQLYEPRSLVQAIAIAAAPDAYLRDLHPKHAGFRNLQKALVAARGGTAVVETPPPEPVPQAEASPKDRRGKAAAPQRKAAAPAPTQSENVQRIIANMERWRWMPDDLGTFHVWNNVPEQMTVVLKGGQVVFHERIVVGKPDTATPNFSANMQFVIFQPEWGVPNGIKNNEIGPALRRASNNGWFFGDGGPSASSVLARHGLRVSYGGQMVNPDNINWSSVDINRFSFIQPAGPANVLGVVKFRFPNKHDVYMHDTPQKHLFASSVRAFSHGCMRVQNPVRFAEVLLEQDKGWNAERVRGMVPRGGEVKLSTEIPVHNVYFTAIAGDDGKVRALGDLYGMDSRIISAIEGRFVTLPSRGEMPSGEPPAPPAEGQVAQRAKGGDRQARQQQKRGKQSASSDGFNPFAGLFGN